MATRPVILTVDDDANVLRAIERDLRREYGRAYRVMRADSGPIALDTVRQLRLRNDPVALFLVDQRMPQMSGVEFLEEAIQLYPDSKRALLTAYADTDAAIQAINAARIDYYLMKPWDPPQENLYPVLSDLLDDWQAGFQPPFEGLRVVGHRWSADTHTIKDFLARNQVPYQGLDVEDAEARQLLQQTELDTATLPIVFFPNGDYLVNPTNTRIAEHPDVQLTTQATRPFFDLVIVGAGPAGLAAAVYGASEGLRTVLLEREAPGGQAGTSSRIENYLGFPSGLTGADLARRALTQARRFGVEVLTPQEVVSLRLNEPYRTVVLQDGSELSGHALIIATGVSYRRLDAPGVERLTGAGVYYGAAITEALSCKDEHVYIVGGANSAGQAAIYLAQFARNVTVLVRAETLARSMSHYLIDRIEQIENIAVRTHTVVAEAHGDTHLEGLTLSNRQSGQTEQVSASALFIFIGAAPRTEWLANVIERDNKGFVLSGPDLMPEGKLPPEWPLKRPPYLLEASVPGVFVVGDVRHGSVKRVASGVGEGSVAVMFVHQHLAQQI